MCEVIERKIETKKNWECEYRYSLTTEKFTVRRVVERQLKKFENKSIKFFFSRKGYEDFVNKKIEAFNASKFKKFSYHEHPDDQISYISPVMQWVHMSDTLKVRNPPIRITNFERLSKYKQEKIGKEADGVVGFLNPSLLLIEHIPFIEDENSALQSIAKWLDKRSEISRNQLIDLKNYIEYLIGYAERKRSKLDFLLSYFREMKFDFETTDEFQIELLKHTVVPNDDKLLAPNGMYLMRKNGELVAQIYYLIYESVEYWTFPPSSPKSGFIKIPYPTNKYFYVNHIKNKFEKIKGSYLLFNKDKKDVIEQYNDESIRKINSVISMQKVQTGPINYTSHMILFIYKKRLFPNEVHQSNILFKNLDPAKGFVHARGVRIINIFVKQTL